MPHLGFWLKKVQAQAMKNNHITTVNYTTSAQLLGIRPTLISCVCVVGLENKQRKNICSIPTAQRMWHYNQDRMLFRLSMYLFHQLYLFFLSYHTQGKLNWSTHEAFWSAFNPGNVYLIHPGFLCLFVCPRPRFSPLSSFLFLSLLSASDPP